MCGWLHGKSIHCSGLYEQDVRVNKEYTVLDFRDKVLSERYIVQWKLEHNKCPVNSNTNLKPTIAGYYEFTASNRATRVASTNNRGKYSNRISGNQASLSFPGLAFSSSVKIYFLTVTFGGQIKEPWCKHLIIIFHLTTFIPFVLFKPF